MIRHLKGIVLTVEEDGLILETSGGVGYHLMCPAGRIMPPTGSAVEMWVETIWREDSIRLYGFDSNEERRWFCALIRVPGVGPALAMGLLGVCPPARLSTAILADDAKTITLAPGVGNKVARRIINEFRDARSGALPALFAGGEAADVDSAKEPEASALKALTGLGYSEAAALTAIGKIMRDAAETPALEDIIRSALRQLASY